MLHKRCTSCCPLFWWIRTFWNKRWRDDIPVIDWKDADKYYNQYVIIEGTIVDIYNSGNVCFLNFDTNYQYFTAVIFASDFPGFPFIPEVFYLGKTVYIIGIIKEYNGSPEIIVKTPQQIRIIRRGVWYININELRIPFKIQ
jgi:DNA/RNA endonuclease YhcR with UshA esterase domain